MAANLQLNVAQCNISIMQHDADNASQDAKS